MRVCARLRVCVFDHLCRGGVVDLQLRDPSLGLCGLFEQHFLFTVNESLNSSKALVTLEFLARRSYVGLPNPLVIQPMCARSRGSCHSTPAACCWTVVGQWSEWDAIVSRCWRVVRSGW